jgi:opacity protein-like surface antigen
VETTATWRYHPAGFLNLSARYGFEESSSATSRVEVLRTGISLVQAFSARLRGSAGVTFLHRTTTDERSDFESTEDTFDLNLGAEYTLSRRWSLNASYSFTTVISSEEFTDYYRNRLFFGAEYSF